MLIRGRLTLAPVKLLIHEGAVSCLSDLPLVRLWAYAAPLILLKFW